MSHQSPETPAPPTYPYPQQGAPAVYIFMPPAANPGQMPMWPYGVPLQGYPQPSYPFPAPQAESSTPPPPETASGMSAAQANGTTPMSDGNEAKEKSAPSLELTDPDEYLARVLPASQAKPTADVALRPTSGRAVSTPPRSSRTIVPRTLPGRTVARPNTLRKVGVATATLAGLIVATVLGVNAMTTKKATDDGESRPAASASPNISIPPDVDIYRELTPNVLMGNGALAVALDMTVTAPITIPYESCKPTKVKSTRVDDQGQKVAACKSYVELLTKDGANNRLTTFQQIRLEGKIVQEDPKQPITKVKKVAAGKYDVEIDPTRFGLVFDARYGVAYGDNQPQDKFSSPVLKTPLTLKGKYKVSSEEAAKVNAILVAPVDPATLPDPNEAGISDSEKATRKANRDTAETNMNLFKAAAMTMSTQTELAGLTDISKGEADFRRGEDVVKAAGMSDTAKDALKYFIAKKAEELGISINVTFTKGEIAVDPLADLNDAMPKSVKNAKEFAARVQVPAKTATTTVVIVSTEKINA